MTSSVCYAIALVSIAALLGTNTAADSKDWWQTTVIYQVYPRSFKDSDGDGIGDLRGIAEKANYFHETGIKTIWLSPIFTSPMVDFGYDISNYTDIDPTFGDLDDFKFLLQKLKSLDIRLILDFVPNHSSDQHEWFQKSEQKIDPYTDYYVWLDGNVDSNGTQIPPNNWRSLFGGSAWQWSSKRKQYYLHQFAVEQPDLNYSSLDVIKEMQDVLKYWLDLGVDGFRVDAMPYLTEDSLFRDEPFSSSSVVDNNDYLILNHIYTKDWPDTYTIIEYFRSVLDAYKKSDGKTRLMLGEAYTTINHTMEYYSQERNRTHMPFNFNLITYLNSSSLAIDIKNAIYLWLDNMPQGKWPNWVTGNHDNSRVASKFGQEMVDPMNTLLMLLPGTAITYQGEEIGMSNGIIRWDQTVDPLGKMSGPDEYEKTSRDPFRTPFQWNSNENAGFSTSKHTWLPVNSNYWYLNLDRQKSCLRSHYQTYKTLVQLRSLQTIIEGDLTVYTPSDSVLIFTRQLNGSETFIVILNVGTEQESIVLTDYVDDVPVNVIVRSSSINSYYAENDIIVTIQPLYMITKSSLVLSYQNIQLPSILENANSLKNN